MKNSVWRENRQRKLRLEFLESRAMLAGNVSVSVSGGNLVIRGDNADNGVLIQQIDADSYAVTGISVGTETTITDGGANVSGGGANGTAIADGVTGDVNIDLRGGDDILGVGNDVDALVALALEFNPELVLDVGDAVSLEGTLSVNDDLTIRTGDGEDLIGVIANVDDVADIDSGRHDDGLGVINSTIGNDLLIRTNSGVDGALVRETGIDDLLSIITSNDADLVQIETAFTRRAVIDTGSGDDAVIVNAFDVDREIVVVTASGEDAVNMQSFSAGTNLVVNTGSHDDVEVSLTSFNVDGAVTVVTGSGNEGFVELVAFDARNVVLDTGSGNDGNFELPVTVANANIDDNLTVVTGSGEDIVLVANVGVGDNLVVNTGAHTDTLDVVDSDVGRDAVIVLGSNSSGAQEIEFLTVFNVNVDRNAVIDAGSGRDFVIIEGSSVDGRLTAVMGSGDDFLHICTSTAGGATLNGGSGDDDLQSELDIEDLPPGFVVVLFDDFFECEDGEEVPEEQL
jgi:hypothetical protein